MVRILALGTVVMLCALSSIVVAAEGKPVLFVAAKATPFSARVCAEIEAMGFEIVPAAAFDEAEPSTAVAVARVLETPPPRRVELWIANPSSRRLELRAVVQPSPVDDEATQTVRASEQLRAFFQPLREHSPEQPVPPETPSSVPILPKTPPPVDPAPPRLPRPPPRPLPMPPVPRRRFVVEASATFPFEPGGPGVDLLLGGRWMAASRVGLGVLAGIPLAGSIVRSGSNSANVTATLVGVDLSVVLLGAPALQVTASAGLAVAWLRAIGAANPPYSAKSEGTFTAVPLLGLELAPRLTDSLRLCLGGRVGISLPKSDIAFVGSTVATWGRPLGLLSAGLRLDF